MKETKYNTNLASEYYILSCLYRKNIEAYLTLGNKKAVDIVIETDSGYKTIDVKGLAGNTTFRIENIQIKKNHYIIFVSFKDAIDNLSVVPEIYIVPSTSIPDILKTQKNNKSIYLSTLRKIEWVSDNWDLLK